MTTWVAVMLKYITAGMSFALTTTQTVIGAHVIPASSWSWIIVFDPTAGIGLLTIVFGLYFGNKFSPQGKPPDEDAAQDRRDIRLDAAQDRKAIREDAAEDRKDIREGT